MEETLDLLGVATLYGGRSGLQRKHVKVPLKVCQYWL